MPAPIHPSRLRGGLAIVLALGLAPVLPWWFQSLGPRSLLTLALPHRAPESPALAGATLFLLLACLMAVRLVDRRLLRRPQTLVLLLGVATFPMWLFYLRPVGFAVGWIPAWVLQGMGAGGSGTEPGMILVAGAITSALVWSLTRWTPGLWLMLLTSLVSAVCWYLAGVPGIAPAFGTLDPLWTYGAHAAWHVGAVWALGGWVRSGARAPLDPVWVRPRGVPLCHRCGYDLRGVQVPYCPECNAYAMNFAPFDDPLADTISRRGPDTGTGRSG
jgi:MFS family permease